MAEKNAAATDAAKAGGTPAPAGGAARGSTPGTGDTPAAAPAPGGTATTGAPAPVGTAAENEAQGFTGVKVQADQQALEGHRGEEVPVGGNPLDTPAPENDLRSPERKVTQVVPPQPAVQTQTLPVKPYRVRNDKFHYGGTAFKKGETIYLTDAEAATMRHHLQSKEQADEGDADRRRQVQEQRDALKKQLEQAENELKALEKPPAEQPR